MGVKVKLDVEVPDVVLGDIMCTMIEHNPMVQGWAYIPIAQREGNDYVALKVEPNEETGDDEWEATTVDREKVGQAIQDILDRKVGLSDEIYVSILRGVLDSDAGEIDAIGADCILQMAVMGDVIYG